MKSKDTNTKEKKSSLLKWIVSAALLLTISGFVFGDQAYGQDVKLGNESVRAFWSESDNIFLFHPNLVRDIFFSIIELKGNKTVSKNRVNRDVLDCRVSARLASSCWIDQLTQTRIQNKISNRFQAPVNINGVDIKKYKPDKMKRVLTFTWNRPVFQPPAVSIGEFMANVGASPESEFYRLKDEVYEIALNPVFQREIEVVVYRNRALNLQKLYQNPPKDYSDSVIFEYDTVVFSETGGVAVFEINLKAIRITVNHQTYETNPDATL